MSSKKAAEDIQARNLEAIRALARIPGNDKCADCGAKFPRFSSITLGIFLCNRCYGIHRNVGAHITRTKCIGLDTWRTEEVEFMKRMGNVRAAEIWLGHKPSTVTGPSLEASDSDVERWIRDKYERRLFFKQPQDRLYEPSTRGSQQPMGGQEPIDRVPANRHGPEDAPGTNGTSMNSSNQAYSGYYPAGRTNSTPLPTTMTGSGSASYVGSQSGVSQLQAPSFNATWPSVSQGHAPGQPVEERKNIETRQIPTSQQAQASNLPDLMSFD